MFDEPTEFALGNTDIHHFSEPKFAAYNLVAKITNNMKQAKVC